MKQQIAAVADGVALTQLGLGEVAEPGAANSVRGNHC